MTDRPNCAHRSASPTHYQQSGRRRYPIYACRCPDLDAESCSALPIAGAELPSCEACDQYRMPAPLVRPPTPTPTRGHYRDLDDLARDTMELAGQLPENLAGVVALPRSGMMPAAILATIRHLPLWTWTPDGPRPTGAGARGTTLHKSDGPLLLVDDSIYTGRTLAIARESMPAGTLTAAIYATPTMATNPDFTGQVIAHPHLFSWNLYNAEQTKRFAFDLDGIICRDIEHDDDDDGPRYLTAIRHARPQHLPRRIPAAAIITARPEPYRTQTAAWLDAHAVKHSALVMPPARMRDPTAIAKYKAAAYRESNATLYVESDDHLARLIHQHAERPVLCPVTKTIYGRAT